jgi:hypothetical protein
VRLCVTEKPQYRGRQGSNMCCSDIGGNYDPFRTIFNHPPPPPKSSDMLLLTLLWGGITQGVPSTGTIF